MPEDPSAATLPPDENSPPDPAKQPDPTLKPAPATDTPPTPDTEQEKSEAAKTDVPPPAWGDANVGTTGVCVISLYLVGALIGLIFCLSRTWTKFDACAVTAKILVPDINMLCLVAIVGALGALIHAMRSFYAYVGNGQLKYCWLPMYILLPFIGAALASVFFLILKGILSTGPATGGTYNTTLGYLAVAGIVGLFTNETVEKIQEVAQTILGKKQEQKNPLNPTTPTAEPAQPAGKPAQPAADQ